MSEPARPPPPWALFAAIAGSSMSFIDSSAVNVALPNLQRDLGASAAELQWVVEGYGLFLSALILIGGSLGDAFGRRRVYGFGIALFALASVVCGLAPNVAVLVAARCLQGVGGALATPGSLALITANYDGTARGRAIGTWSGFSAITSAIGPLIGGWLVQVGSWRWIFFINIPLAALTLAVLLRVRESRDASASHHIDFPGASLATLGLGALVYGLIALQGAVADPKGLGAVAAGTFALIAFVLVERRSRAPMMRLELFASRAFTVANLYTFLLYAALGGSLYFLPFELINVEGYSPAAAGAALLPFVAILFTLSRFSGGLSARMGPRLPLAVGGLLAACGFTLFAFAHPGAPYWRTYLPGAIVLGFGGAAFVAPLTTTVMEAVDVSHAGIASGINNAISRAAGLVAIAALGIALATAFQTSLARDLAGRHLSAPTRAALAAGRAVIVAGRVPPDVAPAAERAVVGGAVRAAFARGFHTAMLASAALSAAAGLLAALAFRGRVREAPLS